MPKDEYLVYYDVIIYEHLEASILWIDDNPDHSEQGKSMAIPVEYVRGVIEVKSAFSKKTAADAISQLAKLKQLLQKIDPPQHQQNSTFRKGSFELQFSLSLEKNMKKNLRH